MTITLWLVLMAMQGGQVSQKLPSCDTGATPCIYHIRISEPVELPDVPAVKVKGPHFCWHEEPMMSEQFVAKLCGKTHWTCADKTRILIHDQQSPPVYWCHRVQTEGR